MSRAVILLHLAGHEPGASAGTLPLTHAAGPIPGVLVDARSDVPWGFRHRFPIWDGGANPSCWRATEDQIQVGRTLRICLGWTLA